MKWNLRVDAGKSGDDPAMIAIDTAVTMLVQQMSSCR